MEAAWAAGRHTLATFTNAPRVEWKADGSPVTAADREAEGLARRVISRAFPDHAVLGEEGGERGGEEGIAEGGRPAGTTSGAAPVRWVIDPIDGTRTFARGVPLYGVLIGVEVAGDPQVGVVFMPALGEMVAAARGLGCTWNGRPCRVAPTTALGDALVNVSDIREAQRRSPAYDRLAARTYLQRTWADCYAYVLVATGRAEIALDPTMNPWDCAAVIPIIEEAGGRVTSWAGQRTIDGGDLVATNGLLHDEVLALLAED